MPLRIDLVYDAERGPGHAIARIHDQRAVPGRIEMSVLRNSDQFYLRADGSWASSESWLPLPEAAIDGNTLSVRFGPPIVDSIVGAPPNIRFHHTMRLDGIAEPAHVKRAADVRTSGAAGSGRLPDPPPIAPPPVAPAPASPVIEVPPAPEPTFAAPVMPPPSPRQPDAGGVRLPMLIGGAVALVTVIAVAVWYFTRIPETPGPEPVAAAQTKARAAPPTAGTPENLADINKFLSQNPPPNDAHRMGKELLEKGKPDLAMLLFQSAARSGQKDALLSLARMYDPESWSPQTSPMPAADAETAAYWYEPAAKAGDVFAQRRLGKLLVELNLSPTQREQGIEWLKKAKEAGDAEAGSILETVK